MTEINKKRIDNRERDYQSIVMERINSQIEMMVEGQKMLEENMNRKLDALNENMENQFQILSTSDRLLARDVQSLKEKLDTGFAKSFEYMSRIEEELTCKLETKVDNAEHDRLERRVEQLEGIHP